MTPKQISLIKQTFEQIWPSHELVAALFYRHLFQLAPNLRQLFVNNMSNQGRKFMEILGLVVDDLEHLDQVLPVARKLGAQHVRYGVLPEHYELVGAALIWTLQEALQNQFTSETEMAWQTVYNTLAQAMKEGAAGTIISFALAQF